jgi:hypothetical protein
MEFFFQRASQQMLQMHRILSIIVLISTELERKLHVVPPPLPQAMEEIKKPGQDADVKL